MRRVASGASWTASLTLWWLACRGKNFGGEKKFVGGLNKIWGPTFLGTQIFGGQ